MNETTRETRPLDSRGNGISLGTIVFGLILLAIGVLWLLDAADVLSVTWTLVGAVLLIVVGIGLILGAREGSHGGLVFLGIVLAFVVLLGSLADWGSFDGSLGDRVIVPESIDEVEDSYDWGAGTQTLDLREIDFPDGETTVSMRVGLGELIARIPEDIAVRVEWQGGVGDAQVLEREQSGFGLDGTYESDDFEEQATRLILDLQVGMGSIEVTR